MQLLVFLWNYLKSLKYGINNYGSVETLAPLWL